MTVVTFVSSNPAKFREVRSLLRPFGHDVRWRREELPEVQAADLATVARGKLEEAGVGRGYVLVEDSGLFIRALHGFPGVYSAHFLKIWGFDPIFELLRHRDRAARFQTVAAVGRGRERWTFTGEVRGSIARRPSGSEGFGYDPIFVPEGWKQTFADVPLESKSLVSHRARALRKVARFLTTRTGRARR